MRRPIRSALAGLALLPVLAACGGTDPYGEGATRDDGGGKIVVGSADFPESTLLAHIYAQALEAKGLDVGTQLNIGSREVYYDQIAAGNLSVFPEYNGSILTYLDPGAEARGTEETDAAVTERLPEGLEILDPSPAENKDSVTVTEETARKEGLKTLADLEKVAGNMTLGGPSEFETRAQGVPGLEKTYGVTFGNFRALDVSLLPQALKDGDVQAANLFTTDPAIVKNGFVPLEDPDGLFGTQNVTPLVYGDAVDEEARAALDAVSAELTTETLSELNERVSIDHENAADVASDWLASAGLA
ncbi:osmoprotectant transport system substrate-binding protein [Nocardiopsis mwathae]|uniref:Osmoprotectant transport system substrate-binding protein n=1 Tax=Nocardiopsis mwathae TaxID=1472723 RepID=A0A7W9YE48_9ACTN|nr:ABC transporter substrate-binding protein [Nocardiopsis mwathae]MBB6170384.1 osmoprotectant transport system substrate-binding protein [Nocardiopsis mwathae]